MLKHENNPPPQAPSQPAANVRVTPEELAAAVTALQIRKEGSPGTIAIGDAVEELGLDVTPEEVLAEVESQRIQQRYLVRRLSPRRLKVLLVALLALVGVSIWGISQQPPGNLDSETQPVATTSYSVPIVSSARITYNQSLVVADSSGKLMMLSEVGDNQPVTCALNGGSLQQGTGMEPFLWTLVKHNSKVYIRGWMAKTSSKVLQENGANVSALQNSASVPVTLPIDGFKFSETPQDVPGREFHADNIHLDGHAYEKW